jgi:hypothetical protein
MHKQQSTMASYGPQIIRRHLFRVRIGIGVAAGVVFAPKPGRETRELLGVQFARGQSASSLLYSPLLGRDARTYLDEEYFIYL